MRILQCFLWASSVRSLCTSSLSACDGNPKRGLPPITSWSIPSSHSLTTVMRRWCRCGCAAVWRRGELSRVSDVLLLSPHNAPGRLIPNLQHLQKASGSSTSKWTVQVTHGLKMTRCYKLSVSNSLFNSTHALGQWGASLTLISAFF